MNKILIKVFFFFNLLIFSNFSSFADTFIYSGGCFWCTEADTEKLKGVDEVISGFTAGTTKDPKYIPGQWGDHREAALVKYDPKTISFKDLVVHVFKTIDYEDNDGQFCDRGRSYSPAIYYKTNEEKLIVLKSLGWEEEDWQRGRRITDDSFSFLRFFGFEQEE